MWFVIRWLLYLVMLGLIGLVGYTYIGPIFGADFSPPQVEIREPVTLDAQ